MSESLSTEHFDEVITSFKSHMDERFDTVEDRLDRIEDGLWHGQRLEEYERRIIKLAENTGSADLAIPFTRPIGS